MKRYEKYKTINLPWLSEIPIHWALNRNKVFLKESKDVVGESSKDYNLLSLTKSGIIPRDVASGKGKFPSDFSTYKIICPGDMVFCLFDIDETPRTVGLSSHHGMLTGAYDVFHVTAINSKYMLYYYLALDDVKAMRPLYKGLRKTINVDTFLETKLPVPPRDEQDQIVRYLDWQVSKINRLIAAKRKQIELLSEEKQNIINAAVLHGVNDRCEKRTSPILFADWIPSHWRVLRGKYLFAEHDRRTETGNEVLLSVSHITGVTPRSEKNITMFQAESLVGYKICAVDDIAANTMWMWQGAIAVSDYYGVISPSYNTYHQIGNHYNRKYLDYLLRSNVMVNEYKAKSTGIRKSRLRLYPEQFLSMSFPIPPMDEQLEIVKYIEAKVQRIEVMVSTIHAEIQKIQDLRARLISDVVTGQIDVRGIEVPTFEYIDESNNNDENTEEMEAELDG